jgi:hypothetical protein
VTSLTVQDRYHCRHSKRHKSCCQHQHKQTENHCRSSTLYRDVTCNTAWRRETRLYRTAARRKRTCSQKGKARVGYFAVRSRKLRPLTADSFRFCGTEQAVKTELVCFHRTGIAQSVQRHGTGYTVRGSNPGGNGVFCTPADRPWGPPILVYRGYREL